jgi:Cu/Ag efflux protein CusF
MKHERHHLFNQEIRMKCPSTMIVALSLLGAMGLPAAAQQAAAETKEYAASAPGKATMARTQKIVATVEAIDLAKREVTLKGPKGKVVTLTAGPDVRNLEQVKVGDSVVVGYLEALSLKLIKDGKELRGSTSAADGARSAAGERPAGVVAEEVKVIADVIAVDSKNKIVTLRGPKQTVDLRVNDPQQLKLIKVGDQVEAVYAQALALSVEPAPSAKK